jgi:hypothetical protein
LIGLVQECLSVAKQSVRHRLLRLCVVIVPLDGVEGEVTALEGCRLQQRLALAAGHRRKARRVVLATSNISVHPEYHALLSIGCSLLLPEP